MSPEQATSTEKTKFKPGWLLLSGGTLLVLIVCFLMFLFIVLVFGNVYGEEFAADTFKRRTFSYYEIPLLHWQVSGIRRLDSSGPLEKHLANKSLIGKPKTKQKGKTRWDLVSSNRTEPNSPICDANILCAHLDQRNENYNFRWLDWSKSNPEMAKVLWPTVAGLAQRQLYVHVPDLLLLAKRVEQPEPLQRQIDLALNHKFRFLAQNEQKLERHESAVRWFSEALARKNSDVKSLQGRAKSLQMLGKKDRAAADLAEVQRINSATR